MFRTRTTHDCFDSGLYFKNIKWFCNIVICPVVQSKDLVHVLTFCSKHDDRNIGEFSDLLADFQSIHLRKHQVQKDNIVFILLCLLNRFFSVISTVNFHTVLFQIKTDSFYDQFLVINY